MKVVFSDNGWDDFNGWRSSGNDKGHDRVVDLIEAARRTPFQGLGKPEPLKGDLKGWWSRRITEEHRLVYRVRGTGVEQCIEIAQARYHY